MFGAVFGIPGMIIGVPTFAVLYAATKAIINSSLKKKELPITTELYYKLEAIDSEGNIIEKHIVEEKKDSSAKVQKPNIFIKLWNWLKRLFKFQKKK